MPTLDRDQAIHDAWEIGRLRYKLQPRQREVYNAIHAAPPEEVFTVLCHRGFGKTFIGCSLALETTRRESDCNVLIISSTLKKLRTIVKPAFTTLMMDCPEEYRLSYNTQDSCYRSPSNVTVHLCAAEHGHIEDLRGIHKVTKVLIDEAAFFGDEEDSYPLDNVIESILNPMFIRTKSKAQIVMMSTPPEIPNHPFKNYYERALSKNCAAMFNIFKSDVPPDRIAEMRARCLNEDAWRREYLCEWVVDMERMIIPEWDDKYIQDLTPTPYWPYYQTYLGMDI